uniref:Fibrinogen C-terminal domain-containing protein n=1 Tax=Strix occidentalis caurina TaxID=311401 RepID=A0A8D0FZX4_STROC
MLSNSFCSLLGASRSPWTHSVHSQVLSGVLHSYPAASMSSLFLSLCSLGHLCCPCTNRSLPSPPDMLKCPPSISLCMHPDLLCPPSSSTQISSVPLSVCLVPTPPLCACSHPSFPQVPVDSHCTLHQHSDPTHPIWCCSLPASSPVRSPPSSLHPPFPSILPNTYPDPSIPSLCTRPDPLLSPWRMLRPLCSPLCLLRSLLLPDSTPFLGRLSLSPVPSTLHGQSLKGHAPEPTTALQKPFSRPVQLPPCNLEDISSKEISTTFSVSFEVPAGSPSGIYIIQPTGLHPIVVSCEMNVTDGGWTVIQRNQQSTEITWAESWSTYKYGFGNVHSDYWLGTEYIHWISQQKVYQVRFVIWDASNNTKFADYNLFNVEDESQGYRLRLGTYSGTAEDAMASKSPSVIHDNMKFSAKDLDQDTSSGNCASSSGGGWWYSACYSVRLNVKGAITWGSLSKLPALPLAFHLW